MTAILKNIFNISNKKLLKDYGLVLAFMGICLVLSILSPSFIKPANLLNILRQTSINGILAVGMTFVIITGGIDLSVGSITAVAAVVASSFAHPGEHSIVFVIFSGLGVGLLLGFINGLFIAKAKLAPFIATLGMMTIARGMALVYTSGRPVINLSDQYNYIGGGYIGGIPVPVYIYGLVVIISFFVLRFTVFGRRVYAVGGNELSAKYSGIKTSNIKTLVYMISGMLSGLAGIVLSSRVMSGNPSAGTSYELDAIAAVVIGGTSMTGGVGTIFGTVIGALMIGVINNGLDLLNVSSYFQQIVKGSIIIFAVLMDKQANSKD
ncbi:MAG: sugar ABC transporter permease [Spirochaetaceae bacterium 4572_59]|nr:MAG: sugar ABC transporter permease [Spirochaetaceae bacterium 4572_59]